MTTLKQLLKESTFHMEYKGIITGFIYEGRIVEVVKIWLEQKRLPDTLKNADKNALIDKLLEELQK